MPSAIGVHRLKIKSKFTYLKFVYGEDVHPQDVVVTFQSE